MRASEALLALAAGAALTAAGAARAAESASRHSLAEFQSLAEREGAQLGEQRAKVEYSRAREEFAASQGRWSGTVDTLITATPGASGNAVQGQTEWDNWGPLSLTKLEVVQPVYTFGAIPAAGAAARAGTQAEEKLLERDRWALRTQVAEFYYGYQLAFEFSELADSLVSDLSKALDKALEKSSKVSERDADKLRVVLSEAQSRLLEARKGMDQARIGMAWKLGRYGQESPRWDRANLVAREFKLGELAVYQQAARAGRPELGALASDVNAKEALLQVEQGLRLPTVFVAGRLEYAYAPTRNQQHSPFAYDPTNGFAGGAALGVRWNLGIFEKNAKVGQARAELLQAQARQRHFEPAVLAEVEKDWLDARQAMESLKLRTEGATAARRVFRDLAVAYTLGTSGDAKALLESLGQYAVAEKARLEALYAHNVAIVKLEQACGQSF